MRDLMMNIENDIALGVLSFAKIAAKYQVPMSWVNEVWNQLREQEARTYDSWYDDQFELADES